MPTRSGQTTNISNLSVERFLNLQIPLPTFSEQIRIASILDKADAITKARRDAIELSERLIRSTFLQQLGNLFDQRISVEKGRSLDSSDRP